MPSDEDSQAAVSLRAESNPSRWRSWCEHCTTVANQRIVDLHDVRLTVKATKTLAAFAKPDAAGKPDPATFVSLEYVVYPLVSPGQPAPERFLLGALPPPPHTGSVKTERLESVAVFIDANNLSMRREESRTAIYNINVP